MRVRTGTPTQVICSGPSLAPRAAFPHITPTPFLTKGWSVSAPKGMLNGLRRGIPKDEKDRPN
jgi:hypothetical protein